MIITPPAAESATGTVAELYDDDLRADGLVYAHTAAMATNPEAYRAFEALVRAVVPSIGIRLYEAATLGAARAIGSEHCLLAHGRKALRAEVVDEAGLAAFAAGDDSGFRNDERLVIRYAERLSRDPAAMTDADTQELRGPELFQPGAARPRGAGRRGARARSGARGGAARRDVSAPA